MARYIDADAVIKEIDAAQVSLESNNDAMWEINKKYYKGLCMARRIIDEQPTADVVEVVRCKDCVYFKQSVSPLCPHANAFICDFPYGLQKNVSENDFCCHGEKDAQQVVDANSAIPTPDPAASLKSEVDQLKKALEAKDAECDQALQDKARECNIAIDKIRLEHREEIRALQEKHEAELAKAKREVARKIFADIELLIDKYSLEPNYLLLHLKKDIAEFKKQHNKN